MGAERQTEASTGKSPERDPQPGGNIESLKGTIERDDFFAVAVGHADVEAAARCHDDLLADAMAVSAPFRARWYVIYIEDAPYGEWQIIVVLRHSYRAGVVEMTLKFDDAAVVEVAFCHRAEIIS